MDLVIKRAKGVIIFFGFFAFALSIMAEPNIGLQKRLELFSINPQVFAALFLVAAVGCLIYAFKDWAWNGLLFSPYFVFAAMAIDAAYNSPTVSWSAATVYSFLGALLILEFIVDNELVPTIVEMFVGRNKRTNER
jgi:hypothetical protein